MRVVVFAIVVVGLASCCFAIGPRPEAGLLTDGQPRPPEAALRYFAERPQIIDVPQIPPTTSPVGSSRALVILVDFDDKEADRLGNTAAFFGDRLFSEDQPSLRSYLHENSYGTFLLTGDVHGWFRCPCEHRDIVNRDRVKGTIDDHGLDISPAAIDASACEFPLNVWGLVANTVNLADEEVDFSAYDNDGPDGIPNSGDDDGFVDALFIVHSGPGAEDFASSPDMAINLIWSLQSSLDYYRPTRNTTADGVRIGAFVIVPETGQIGVFAHEFCHLLGLPDLYDTDSGKPVVGPFCLMDQGAWNGPQHLAGSVPSHLCAPMKYMLGWIHPQEVCLGCDGADNVKGAQIHGLGSSPSAYRALNNPGGMDWSPDRTGAGEYFILESRHRSRGFFEAYLPVSGLLIWKVDESQPNNNNLARTLAEIIQADGEVVTDIGDYRINIPGDASDVWPGSLGRRDFTPNTTPPSNLSRGRFSGVAVANIDPLPLGTITADISVGLPKKGGAYVYPNPHRIVFLPDPGPDSPISFKVTIFDLEGNLVRVLDGPTETAGNGTALWDVKDEGGNIVDPGLYFYAVESSGQQATGVIGIKK
jgi:immune inhibitor A